MRKDWSLRPRSCSQKGQEEVCSSVGTSERLTEGTKSAPSPLRPRPPFLESSPSKAGQAGSLHLQGARLPGRWSMPACTQGIRRKGLMVQRQGLHPGNPLSVFRDLEVGQSVYWPALSQGRELEPCLSPGVCQWPGSEVSQRSGSHISHRPT